MTKVYKSAVVLIPPNEQWKQIQEIREKYDRNFHRWMPHITLLYPFRPEGEFNLLEQDFQKVCENIESFELRLETFKYFSHGKQRYTIWLEPEPKEPIINLQDKIQQITPDCNDVCQYNRGFIPHLSLGQITRKERLLKTFQTLTSHWESLKFRIENIFFIARKPNKDSTFNIKKNIPLAN